MHYLKLTSHLVSILILSTHCAMPSRAAPTTVTFEIENDPSITSNSTLKASEFHYSSCNREDKLSIYRETNKHLSTSHLVLLATYNKSATFFDKKGKVFIELNELNIEESFNEETDSYNFKGAFKTKQTSLSGKEMSALTTHSGTHLPEVIKQQNQWPALKENRYTEIKIQSPEKKMSCMTILCNKLASVCHHKSPASSNNDNKQYNIHIANELDSEKAITIKEDFIVIAQSRNPLFDEQEKGITYTDPNKHHTIKLIKQGTENALYEHETDCKVDMIKILPDTNETQFVTLQNKSTPQSPETDSKKGLKPQEKAKEPANKSSLKRSKPDSARGLAVVSRLIRRFPKKEELPKTKNTPSVTVWEIKSEDNNPQSIEPLFTLDLDSTTAFGADARSKTPKEEIKFIIPVSNSLLFSCTANIYTEYQASNPTLIKILSENKEKKMQELPLEKNDSVAIHTIALNKETVIGWSNEKTTPENNCKLYVWHIKDNEEQKENPESDPFVIKTFIGTNKERFDTALDSFIKLDDRHMALITRSGHLSILRHKPDSPTNVLAIVYTKDLKVTEKKQLVKMTAFQHPNFLLCASEQSLWIQSAECIYLLPCSAWKGEASAACDSAPMAMEVE